MLNRRLVAVTAALGMSAGVLAATPIASGAVRGDQESGQVTVFVRADSTIRMDTTLRAGVSRFVVRSAREASFQLVQAAPGYTKRAAARDIRRGLEAGRVPALRRVERNVTFHGGIGSTADEHGVLWVRLRAGTYWAIDADAPTARASRILTVRVTAPPHAAAMTRGPVIRAVGEAEWAPTPRRIPARGVLTFRNASSENHHLLMVRLAPGRTMADFEAWLQEAMAGEDSPPPVMFEHFMATGVISPGLAMSMRYRLRPGNYVMLCFYPDADNGGLPHVFTGMYRGIRVG